MSFMFCTVNGCDCQLIIKENYDDDDDDDVQIAYLSVNHPPNPYPQLLPAAAAEYIVLHTRNATCM